MQLSFAGWLKENFGLVATLLGFTVDTITLIALINSKVPPTIPFIDYQLDETIQLVILVIATVTYLGFLKEYWLQLRQKSVDESAYSFLGFLVCDMFVRFKHPFLLVPIVILVGFLFVVAPGIWSASFKVFTFLFLFLLLCLAIQIENQQGKREWSTVLTYDCLSFEEHVHNQKTGKPNYKLSDCWKKRIEEELNKDGYATDVDLAQMYDCSRSVARKAMRSYLIAFESAKKIKLSKENKHSKISNSKSLECLSLSSR